MDSSAEIPTTASEVGAPSAQDYVLPEGVAAFPETELDVNGWKMKVGLDYKRVKEYFSSFIMEHYAQLQGDKAAILRLRAKAVDAMMDFYRFVGDDECFDAAERVQNSLINLDKKYERNAPNRALLEGTPMPAKTNAKRQALEYDESIPYCFSVAETESLPRLQACLAEICREASAQLGHNNLHIDGIVDIFCGQRRDIVLKGDPTLNRIWINHLVTSLVRDRVLCVIHPALADTWHAANQAFLKKNHHS